MAAGPGEVPDRAPAVSVQSDLDDGLADVAGDAGEGAAALPRRESGKRVRAGTGETAVELFLGIEAAGDQIALERDRLR